MAKYHVANDLNAIVIYIMFLPTGHYTRGGHNNHALLHGLFNLYFIYC